MIRNLTVMALALVAFSCKGGSVAGSYTLDKAAMGKIAAEQIAKMPEDQKAFGKLAAELLKQMEINLTLAEGGKGEMMMKMPNPFAGKDAKPEAKTEAITWEKDEAGVVTIKGKDPVSCKVDGSRLTCSDAKKEQALIFVKS